MFSEWGSGLSGPASVPFAVLALWASSTVQRIAYGSLAVILGLFSSYRIWLKEHNEKLTEIDIRTKAENKFFDDRPILVLRIAYSSVTPWESGGNLFVVQNCGARVARWVTVKGFRSRRGKYLLIFGKITSLVSTEERPISCQVGASGDHLMEEFFSDRAPESAIIWFDTVIECLDTDDSLVETPVRIAYDVEANQLSVHPVPYLLKKKG